MLFFPDFNVQQVLSNGTILASKEDETGGMVYLLDSQGKVKTKLGVERSVCSTDEKYYIYEEGIGMYGVSTIDGQKIIKAKYSFLYFTTDGNVIFSDDHERYGIMNTKGEVLIKPRYSMINDCQDGLFIASKDGDSFGLLNMKEERIIGFDYSDLFFVPNSKNLYAEKESDNYVYIIDRKNNEIGDYSQLELGEYGKLQSWFSLMFGEYSKYSDVKSDYFDTKDCIMSLLYPSGKTIDNLYGFAGMKPGDCVDKIGVSLSRDDIGDENHWFPYQYLEQNEYGTITYSLGFEKVVDTYYDEDDYWEFHPHYTFSDYPCDYLNAKLHLNYETQNHVEQIEKNLEEIVMDLESV